MENNNNYFLPSKLSPDFTMQLSMDLFSEFCDVLMITFTCQFHPSNKPNSTTTRHNKPTIGKNCRGKRHKLIPAKTLPKPNP